MSTHGPIVEEHRAKMNELANFLDVYFNGPAKGKDRKVGFALLIFPFGDDIDDARVNYIGNANRQDMLCALKELVARWEGRHIEETATPQPKETQ